MTIVREVNGGEILRIRCKFHEYLIHDKDQLCTIHVNRCPLLKNKLIPESYKPVMKDYGCNSYVDLEWTDYIKYKSL